MMLPMPGRSWWVRLVGLVTLWALLSGQSCLSPVGPSSNRPQHLGVFTSDATITSVGGVLVTGIVPQIAAARAGIRENDILARIDGRVVTSVSELRQRIAAKTLGQPAEIVFFRSTDPDPGVVTIVIEPEPSGSLPNVLGFSVAQGDNALQVTEVQAGSVAEQGGIKVGDQIVSMNGSPTTTLADAWRVLAPVSANNTVSITYRRAGAPTTQPGTTPTFTVSLTASADAASLLAMPGLFVQDLTPALAAHFNYITTTGARITNIYRDSPAFEAGLLVGDIIIGLAPLEPPGPEQKVTTANSLTSLVRNHAGQRVRLRYLRGQLPPATVEVALSGVPEDAPEAPVIGMLIEELPGGGLRVEQVTSDGPAAAAGISRENRIAQVHSVPVATLAEFWERLLEQYDNENFEIVLQLTSQQGPPRFVVLELEPPEE